MVVMELHPAESAGVGALSGIIEVLLQQPSVSIKNSIQDKKPIYWNPRVLYRGVGVNATSIAPIIAIQFGFNSFLQRRLTNNPTALQTVAIAGAAGMVSSLCSGPAELLMIQQQKSGLSFPRQAHAVASKHGWLSIFRGLSPTAVREGIFTACYLGMKPIVQEELMLWPGHSLENRPNLTSFLAASTSGLLAAVVTHPFDTIKTRMQANLDVPIYRTMTSTAKVVWTEGGIRQLYSGIIPRTQRVVCAVYIYGEAKKHLTQLYFKAFAE
ncbi:unnamed protein product [Calypogeia fissa]